MFYADKHNIWNQEDLEAKVKKEVESYKNFLKAACEVAEELYNMSGRCHTDITPEMAEVEIVENDRINVMWYEDAGCGCCSDNVSEEFPISYLWEFDRKEIEQKRKYDIQSKRLKKQAEDKKIQKERAKVARRKQFEQLKDEFENE